MKYLFKEAKMYKIRKCTNCKEDIFPGQNMYGSCCSPECFEAVVNSPEYKAWVKKEEEKEKK